MQTALRTLSQDLPYRLRPEQTTVLEQLGQDRHVFVSLPTGYGKSECLTHWGRVTHTCVSTLTIIGSDNGLSPAWSAPSHYLNQCWNIVNWTLRNKLQWNFNRNSNIFIQNAFENAVCEMASIWSRPQWVNCFSKAYINGPVTAVWI